jgi:hypothetical protein
VSPSHSPKSHSIRSGSVTTWALPSAVEMTRAVAVHLERGDVKTAATGANARSRRAVASAWASPRGESAASPRPE